MKNLCKILLFSITTQAVCLDTQTIDDRTAKLKKHPLTKFETPKNPVKASIKTLVENRFKASSGYSEINKPKLTRSEKSDKFHIDNAIKHNVDKYGAGLSDTAIAMEHKMHFSDLDHDDLVKQGKTYLSSRNRAQNEDLISARKSYKESFAHFETKTRPKALQAIHKLKQEIKDNEHEIENLQYQMNKAKNSADRAQLNIEIATLQSKNNINLANIEKSLKTLEQDINNIEKKAGNHHAAILAHYKTQDRNFLNQVNDLLQPTNRKMTLSKKPKVATAKPRVVSIPQQEPEDEPFTPQVPIPVMAQSPMLETSIATTQESLTQEFAKRKPKKSRVQYLQDELAYLNKAKQYKETEHQKARYL